MHLPTVVQIRLGSVAELPNAGCVIQFEMFRGFDFVFLSCPFDEPLYFSFKYSKSKTSMSATIIINMNIQKLISKIAIIFHIERQFQFTHKLRLL